jgi:hypothetical protein
LGKSGTDVRCALDTYRRNKIGRKESTFSCGDNCGHRERTFADTNATGESFVDSGHGVSIDNFTSLGVLVDGVRALMSTSADGLTADTS